MTDFINLMPIPAPLPDFVKAQDELFRSLLSLAFAVPESAIAPTEGCYSVMANYDAFYEAVAEATGGPSFKFRNRPYPDPAFVPDTSV